MCISPKLIYKSHTLVLVGLLLILNCCSNVSDSESIKITKEIDPDIVLINIGEGNRTSIGKILLSIDSCKPAVVGINAFFFKLKDNYDDSILASALKVIANDIIVYGIDSSKQILGSDSKFTKLVSDTGLFLPNEAQKEDGRFTPIRIINGQNHELFSLKIVRRWKPDYITHFKLNQAIPLIYSRTLEQYMTFEGATLTFQTAQKYLKNKIVLLGYLGPGDEDRYFTPLRNLWHLSDNQPDTYGLIIIANEIRSLMANNSNK